MFEYLAVSRWLSGSPALGLTRVRGGLAGGRPKDGGRGRSETCFGVTADRLFDVGEEGGVRVRYTQPILHPRATPPSRWLIPLHIWPPSTRKPPVPTACDEVNSVPPKRHPPGNLRMEPCLETRSLQIQLVKMGSSG